MFNSSIERLYIVREEFTDQWFPYDEPTAMTLEEIKRLAKAWEMPIEELMEQVEEA